MINDQMPDYVVERIADALNDRGKSLRNSQVLVLGVTYKKDVPDVRESPALKLIDRLLRKGAIVEYHDPFIPELGIGAERMASVELTSETLRRADCVAVITDHTSLPWSQIAAESPVVIDTRNALRLYPGPNVRAL